MTMSRLLENSISSPAPFDALADSYDDHFSDSPIGRAQRKAVWREMDQAFHSGQRVLEINCGTGIDAVHMALLGTHVLACDSAPGMVAVARKRAADLSTAQIRFLCLRTEDIHRLESDGPYDGVLSNFSGLNCVSDLRPVASSLSRLMKPGGRFVLCVFGTFCPWEILWYVCSEKPEKAYRRFRRNGVESHLAPGASVTVHYWTVDSLKEIFSPYFRLERRRGIGVVTPPSFASALVARFPRAFRVAAEIDSMIGSCPGVRAMADHTVLTFQKVREAGS